MYKSDSDDRFGMAVSDYYKHRCKTPLMIHNTYGDPEEYPLDGFFFSSEQFTEMEHFALSICSGRILDVGSVAGRHVLTLNQLGKRVSGLDSSGYCCQVMEMRGVQSIIHKNIFEFEGEGFDTILMLMNGIGLVGSLEGLKRLLILMKDTISDRGQMIFDSSDILYLYEQTEIPGNRYYGELDLCFEYDGRHGSWFSWLYIDQDTLKKVAASCGWHTQIIYEDNTDQYLARLLRI